MSPGIGRWGGTEEIYTPNIREGGILEENWGPSYTMLDRPVRS